MTRERIANASLAGLVACCGLSTSGCKVAAVPFRVAGAVVDTAYVGGKTAVNKSSNALERRKQRKEQEKAAAENPGVAGTPPAQPAAAAQETNPQIAPPDDVIPVLGPVIPVDDTPLPPIEPVPLPE